MPSLVAFDVKKIRLSNMMLKFFVGFLDALLALDGFKSATTPTKHQEAIDQPAKNRQLRCSPLRKPSV